MSVTLPTRIWEPTIVLPLLTRIDHVGIACRDLDAAIGRYEATFGLQVVSLEVNQEQGVREAMLAVGPVQLGGLRLLDERPRHGSMGASIAFLHPADLGGVLTELVQAAGPA